MCGAETPLNKTASLGVADNFTFILTTDCMVTFITQCIWPCLATVREDIIYSFMGS